MISRLIDRWFDELAWDSYFAVLAALPDNF